MDNNSLRRIMMTLSHRYVENFNTGNTAEIILFVNPTEISLNKLKNSLLFSTTSVFWFLQSRCKHSKSVTN